eukprot:3820132-Amphidinium_carterae.1
MFVMVRLRWFCSSWESLICCAAPVQELQQQTVKAYEKCACRLRSKRHSEKECPMEILALGRFLRHLMQVVSPANLVTSSSIPSAYV